MFQTPDAADLPTVSLLIGGEAGEGSGAAHAHVYPATGQVTKDVRLATPADVDAAVAAARAAAPAWRAMSGDKRRDLFFKLAALYNVAPHDLYEDLYHTIWLEMKQGRRGVSRFQLKFG